MIHYKGKGEHSVNQLEQIIAEREELLYLNNISSQELKNDLVATYNEVEEVLTDFNQLTDEELIEVKETIKQRLENALYWLGKYVSDDDIIESI